MPTSPHPLWTPAEAFARNSHLAHYLNWLHAHRKLHFDDYHALWRWSTEHVADFWASLWEYFDVEATPYQQVVTGQMPHARWFAGSHLNYAAHVFRQASAARPALLFQSEHVPLTEVSWGELRRQTAALAAYLRGAGVVPGDRVVAYLPNVPAATVGFLAAAALGAVWSGCSPDFGVESVADRFRQIEPKVLLAVDGYRYGGKAFDKRADVDRLRTHLPTLEQTILVPYLDPAATLPDARNWSEVTQGPAPALTFAPVPFDHPLWVLYSSGTTGTPKAITHGHGGALLEHLKYLHFHNDCHAGERFFWFTTTGWMMWNFVQAALLTGATAVLYDGSPGYPDLQVLWTLAARARINHLGTSAAFLMASVRAGLHPGADHDLSALRSVGSTGSPLPPEGFAWAYEKVKQDLWLTSMSGGTDVCSAFVGGCPLRPVYGGEIQCRALGCDLEAYDAAGRPVRGGMGEMVIRQPMPSMPLYFWNDPDGTRYHESYFDTFAGVWRHGDWTEITPHDGVVIHGRSDTTLNRLGVRIGTSEIYRAVEQLPAVADSLVVGVEQPDGSYFMPLFVKLHAGFALDQPLRDQINGTLRRTCSPRHVPDQIVAVPEVPYTLSGKKLEAPVKRLLQGAPPAQVVQPGATKNPAALDFYVQFARGHNRNQDL